MQHDGLAAVCNSVGDKRYWPGARTRGVQAQWRALAHVQLLQLACMRAVAVPHNAVTVSID